MFYSSHLLRDRHGPRYRCRSSVPGCLDRDQKSVQCMVDCANLDVPCSTPDAVTGVCIDAEAAKFPTRPCFCNPDADGETPCLHPRTGRPTNDGRVCEIDASRGKFCDHITTHCISDGRREGEVNRGVFYGGSPWWLDGDGGGAFYDSPWWLDDGGGGALYDSPLWLDGDGGGGDFYDRAWRFDDDGGGDFYDGWFDDDGGGDFYVVRTRRRPLPEECDGCPYEACPLILSYEDKEDSTCARCCRMMRSGRYYVVGP